MVVEWLADANLGMLGEGLGQIWANDTGTPLDWKAIIPEGVIGMGPAGARAVFDLAGPAIPGLRDKPYFKDFSESERQYSGEGTPYEVNDVEVGTTGFVTRAGWKEPYRTFNAADGAVANIISDLRSTVAPDDPKAQMSQQYMAMLYERDYEKMSNVRFVLADRTPDGKDTQPGSFEWDAEKGWGFITLI